jgi:hypothetical protein
MTAEPNQLPPLRFRRVNGENTLGQEGIQHIEACEWRQTHEGTMIRHRAGDLANPIC